MIYKSFTEMPVWQNARNLSAGIFKISMNLPKSEDYGLTSQIRRSSNGVSACIAEGFGRFHYLDKAKFYLNARGSLFELKSHLLIASDLKFIDQGIAENLISDIDRLGVKINNFITTTRAKAVKQ